MTANQIVNLANKSKDGFIPANKKKTCEFIKYNKDSIRNLGYEVKLEYITTTYGSHTMNIFLGYTIKMLDKI